MKLFKRFAAVLVAAVLTVSALAVSVSATIFDSAVSISSGKKYSKEFKGKNGEYDYKIKVNAKGTMKISIDSNISCFLMVVYDSDGARVKESSHSFTTGTAGKLNRGDYTISRDYNTGAAKGYYEFDVKKGTYYIQFLQQYDSYKGKFSFSVKTPGGSDDEEVSTKTSGDCFVIYMDEGDKIQLGSVFGGKEEKATWKSSKTSVAKVSSNGKITAVSEGEAEITAKKGSKTIKIKVIVD